VKFEELEYIILKSASNFAKKQGEKAFKDGLVTITQGKKIDNIYHIYGSIKDGINQQEYKTHMKINLKDKKLSGIRCTCDDFSELSANGSSFMCSHLTATAYGFLKKMTPSNIKKKEYTEDNGLQNSYKKEEDAVARLARKTLNNEVFFEVRTGMGSKKQRIEQEDLRNFLEGIKHKKIRFKYEYLEILIKIHHKELPLSFTLKERDNHIVLTTHRQLPIALTSTNDVYLYKNEIYLPSKEQIDKYIPLYEKLKGKGEVIYKKDERSYYKILFLVSSISENINISEELRSFISRISKPNLYIYEHGNNIYCNVFMTYGNEKVNILNSDKFKKLKIRDYKKEEKILMEMERYKFAKIKDRLMFIGEDEELFNLLSNKSSSLKSIGTVTIGKGLKDRTIYDSSFIEAAIYEKDGYFDFSYGIKNIESKELVDIFNEYKQNKPFYKTKNNGFIDFEDEGIRDFLNLLRIINNDKEMSEGLIRIENNKALYLNENIVSKKLSFIKGTEVLEKIENKFSNIKFRDLEIPINLKATLRQYQIDGFKWLKNLSELGFGGILADEMGLGKTIQTIALILSEIDKKFIIVCPTSLIYNWKEEFDRFAPSVKVEIVHGNSSERIKLINSFDKYDVILTTYGTLKIDIENYNDKVFDYCIIDEGQNIKNSLAKNTKAIKALKSKVRFALTGTPIENSLTELWSIFDFIMPDYLYSKEVFEEKFIENEDNIEELKLLIKPFILRRTKKEVMKELPDKIEKKFLVQMTSSQKAIYNTFAKYVRESISSSNGKIEVFSYLMKLRQLCLDPSLVIDDYEGGSGKLKIATALVEEHIETKGKVIIFSQFTSVLNKIGKNLMEKGIEYLHLDGATSSKDRMKMVKEFNKNESTKVFLISLRAGGTGLNLTAANLVIHFDPWWNPAVEDQATDRAHRIGQRNIVEVIKLVAKGTIEEKIVLLQEDKKALIHNIITGELKNSNSINKMSKEDLLQLFQR
jgi:SNF2 family DNA or RNA helicase